ncbi:hypothetical protein D3C85_1922710 [compost metagenome]
MVVYVLLFSVEFGMSIEREDKTSFKRTAVCLAAIYMICYMAGAAAGEFRTIPDLISALKEARFK